MMKPMLAKSMKDVKHDFKTGYYQPKLDGVRLIWDGNEARTRNGKLHQGVPKLVALLEKYFRNFPLDGELYIHGKSFQSFLGSIRRTVNIEEDENIKYYVYDHPCGLTFNKRWQVLKSNLLVIREEDPLERIVLCETRDVEDFESPKYAEKHYTEKNYEGAMWRSEDGLYEFGKRSKNLVKIKSFIDEEFKIIGVEKHKSFEKDIVSAGTSGAKQYADGRWWKNGKETLLNAVGALVCVTQDGKKFEVGSGFDDATRDKLWKEQKSIIGKMVTVKYFELTDDNIPRFPVFKGIRDYE